MKIALFGATGMIGSRIAAEAVARGHDVTAISRSGASVEGTTTHRGDLSDAATVRDLAERHDAVVSATGPSRIGREHQPWLDAIATAAQNVGTARLAVVGGAGSLETNGVRLVDAPGFPDIYRSEALTHGKALDLLRLSPPALDWTYLSPPPEIAPGTRTGAYVLGADAPAGSHISAEDFAVALVDELESAQHSRRRFTAAAAA